MVSLCPRNENHTASLIFNEAFDQIGLLGGESGFAVFTEADITDKNDIIFLEIFEVFGKLLNVVGSVTFAEVGVEE